MRACILIDVDAKSDKLLPIDRNARSKLLAAPAELGDLTEPGHWGDRRITRDPFRYCKIGECGDELVADTPAISARQRGIDTESGNLAKCLILRNRSGAQLRKEIA
ncbi:hypothetical protein WG75_14080 [Citromicrobium sp. WPS32]|nr:hypothetical protein WG75_14080 [Citromicrobium sp. WPS32]